MLACNALRVHLLRDREYIDMMERWTTQFPLVNIPECYHKHDLKAITLLHSHLPRDVYAFTGVTVPYADNLGGRFLTAYFVRSLREIDINIAKEEELILADSALLWCVIFGHEGSVLFYRAFR